MEFYPLCKLIKLSSLFSILFLILINYFLTTLFNLFIIYNTIQILFICAKKSIIKDLIILQKYIQRLKNLSFILETSIR